MQEFQFMLHPCAIDQLLDNATHHLHSVIQFKWSVAEREIHRMMVIMGIKDEGSKAQIERDTKDLRRNKSSATKPYRNQIQKVHAAVFNVNDDRNTLTHGRIEIPPITLPPIHIVLSESSPLQEARFARPGTMSMTRRGKIIPLTANELRSINRKMDDLLAAIYDLGVAINPTIQITMKVEISDASDPGIHFGGGKKEADITGRATIDQVLSKEPLNHYRCSTCGWLCRANPSQMPEHCGVPMLTFLWHECPECDTPTIDGVQMCFHSILSRHYRTGEPLRLTINIGNAEQVIRHWNTIASKTHATTLQLVISPESADLAEFHLLHGDDQGKNTQAEKR